MIRFLPRVAALALAVVATPAAAAEWREASTDHFLIYADASEKWTRGFAERLERMAAVLRTLQPHGDASNTRSNRIVIYVVGLEGVQRLCGRCGSVAGFYVPRAGRSVAYTARTRTEDEGDMTSDIVLFHEYAHHFMFSSADRVFPSWYSEGFAEFLSTMKIKADGSVEIGLPAAHRAYNLLTANMKIEKLFERPAVMNGEEADIFYGRSWMLTHMLTFDKARSGQIDRYLTLLYQGKPNLTAAREAFGDLAILQKQLNFYVTKPMRYVRMSAARAQPGTISLRTLTPGESAMMSVRLRSDRGVDNKQALALIPEARRQAARFATDPGAQVVLAEAEYDAGNDAEAEMAVDRALAADPKNMKALIYKGNVLVRRAVDAKSTDPAAWRAARSWFVKANAIDNDAAEPLLLFYQSFAAAGAKPTANAAAGLARALELSPQDPGLRVLTARQFLMDGKLKDARRVLLPLAFNPHIPADRNGAAKIVAMIDAGKPSADILRTAVENADEADAPAN